MKGQTTRAGWMIAIPALILAAWLAGASVVVWQGLGRNKSRITNHLVRLISGRGRQADNSTPAETGPAEMSDPRLLGLRQAAEAWKRSIRSRRVVVDQVCLVPDVTTFFEAIATWDERYFFPILIDEPAWTLPFLRAFRPARVLRYAGRDQPRAPRVEPVAANGQEARDVVWSKALEAVSRAWTGPFESKGELPDADLPPRAPGTTPPGIVLSAPTAPMLAGAVALAAGRFQPLARLRVAAESHGGAGESDYPRRFGDVLSLADAWNFARAVELCVASLIPSYDRLGDNCDFLTIAADWPYRYSYDRGDDYVRGVYALDDLIGRKFEPVPGGSWINQTRRRWAYTGRLVGDPAASVAHAMGALFLQPTSALLWNTYSGGRPWSEYTMDRAARELNQMASGAATVVLRTGGQSDLASWHRTVDPVNRFGMMLINSSGGPDWFRISGGVGRPSDIPRGVPAAVVMNHSHSAADPTDPQTIAGRWLAQGAFGYFGSVNEPFLLAFRTPRLVAELMAAEVPFGAALRQGEFEAFGFPWRLYYLGDPLYHLEQTPSPPDRRGMNDAAQPPYKRRIDPGDWRKTAPGYATWPVVDIAAKVPGSRSPGNGNDFESEDEKFRWCLDASIGELAGLPSHAAAAAQRRGAMVGAATPAHARPWLAALKEIRRDRLVQRLRSFFDDLLIDALSEAGACDVLMTRLARIPVAERGPRVWQALETCAMTRLAGLVEHGGKTAGFVRALDLWDEVMRLNWPKSAHFPSHFTERVAALSSSDAHRRQLWLGRLQRALDTMATDPGRHPHAGVVAAERKRLEADFGGPGVSR
jgi:hypothetical protein